MAKLQMLQPRIATSKSTNLNVQSTTGWVGSEKSTNLYGRRWRRERLEHLQAEPLCRHCKEKGRVVEATEVDHIIAHRGDMTLFWTRSNWQSLCKPHHSAKTCKENGGFGAI